MLSNLLFASKCEELGEEIDCFFHSSSFLALFIAYRKVNTALIRRITGTVGECAPPPLSINAVFALTALQLVFNNKQ